MITGISEVALWVEDLDRAVEFYTQKLGLEVADIDPGKNAFLKAGDALVVLFNRETPGTALANEYLARVGSPQGEVYHIALKTDKDALDGLASKLCDLGETVKGPVEFATGRRSYFLNDPDKHYIELTDC
ncbi:MAG: VOC family protein [Chthonomonadales bacterium]